MITIDIQKLESNAKEKSLKGVKQMTDLINKPPHYNIGDVPCLKIIKQQLGQQGYLSYLEGNCWKYLYRHKAKEQNISDLKKLRFYNDEMIKELENL